MHISMFILIVLIIFIIILIKKSVNVGIIMFLSSIAVFLISKMSLKEFIVLSFNSLISIDTISLLLIMFLILNIENIMRVTGLTNNIVNNVKGLFSDVRFSGVIMPTIIGMLPSPGGARFSCPIVDDVIGNNANNLNKAYINYWFRHIWMDGFILYPGIIIASKILNIPVIDFFIRLLPFMSLSFIIGIIFSLKNIQKNSTITKEKSSVKSLLISMLPIFILILLYISLLKVTNFGLEISGFIVMVGLIVYKKYNFKQILATFKESLKPHLYIIIIGVMIFKDVLTSSGIIENLLVFFNTNGIPVEIVYFLLPFVGGFSSGIAVSFVSMSFPILLPLGIQDNIWLCILAFVSGFIGVMVSPLHLCGIMTADYFKTKLRKLLLLVSYSESILLLLVIILFYILQA